jgi:serine/threonine protein kinase
VPQGPGEAFSADDETVSWAGIKANRRGERFTILRPHARGGLGVVYIAYDNELDREVALKEIRDKHADDPFARERFIREAQITAKLGHPGICPVHSLGKDENGRPYYAMSLVLGRTLQDAIAEFHAPAKSRSIDLRHSVEFRSLLQSLIDVCGAVSYAHNRAVLHRDLKPSNIMLGPYGETILLDWGLAKSVATDSAASLDAEPPIRLTGPFDSQATLPGSAVGTPSYMSPEQATGRADRVGPKTDIYGLGATLYAILTGVAPVKESTKEETIARVASGKFRPPRAVNPRIPKAIESICLKAMAREPERRYLTPKELAKDIERWLADEPVSSHKSSMWELFRRWVRRHRTPIIVVGLAVTAALFTMFVALAWIQRTSLMVAFANRELQEGRVKLSREQSRREHLRKEQLRREQSNEAAMHRERALRAANAVKFSKLVSDALFKIDLDEDSSVTDTAQLRYDLASVVLANLRQMKSEFPSVPEIDARLSESLVHCGSILETLGRFDSAEEAFGESIKLAKSLTDRASNVQEHRQLLTYALGESIDLKARMRGATTVQSEASELAKLIRDVSEQFPNDKLLQERSAARVLPAANVLSRLGKHDEAINLLRFATKVLDAVADRDQQRPDAVQDAIAAWIGLANSARDKGDEELAESANAAALARAEAWHDKSQRNESEELLTMVMANVVSRSVETDVNDEDEELFDSLVPRLEKLVDDHPASSTRQLRLADVLIARSFLRSSQDRAEEGAADAQRAIDILRSLSTSVPLAYHGELLGQAYAAKAFNLEKIDDPTAVKIKAQATELLRSAIKNSPGNNRLQRLFERVATQGG